MAWLYLGLTDELETRWQATELQLGDFIATSNKISATDRWDEQYAINRQIDWISKVQLIDK